MAARIPPRLPPTRGPSRIPGPAAAAKSGAKGNISTGTKIDGLKGRMQPQSRSTLTNAQRNAQTLMRDRLRCESQYPSRAPAKSNAQRRLQSLQGKSFSEIHTSNAAIRARSVAKSRLDPNTSPISRTPQTIKKIEVLRQPSQKRTDIFKHNLEVINRFRRNHPGKY